MESSNWQTQLSTVRERTQYAFNKSLFCDVKFAVVDSVNGGKVTVPANKYMLAVSSPVFEAMFYGNLAEKRDTIDLPDCTKEGLQELLRFVHSDEVNLTGNNVMEVLYIANKYDMPFLAMKCREYLKECLKAEEVFTVLPQVQKLGDKELEEYCWEVIDNETKLAMSSKPFLQISREILAQVVVRDSLNITEVEIFQAVDKWAAKKIEEEGLESTGDSKRAVLGEDIIRLIRFPLMSQEEFAEVVLPNEILKGGEFTELFHIFSNRPPSTSIFCKKARRYMILTNNRFGNIIKPDRSYFNSVKTYHDGRCDAISFIVNKAISLMGVQMFGEENSSYEVELEILNGIQIISSLSSSYDSEKLNDKYYGFTAKLDEAVSIQPNTLYTIKAFIKGPCSCYGTDGKQLVKHDDGDLEITFKESKRSSNGTNVYKGQFPSLILYRVGQQETFSFYSLTNFCTVL